MNHPDRVLDPGQPLPGPHRVVLALGLLLAALLCVRQVASPDLGFHLRAGEHLLTGHGWPRTDPFTETMRDHPCIDTSWGFQVLTALVFRAGGPAGLELMVMAIVLGWLTLLYRLARLQPVNPTALVILVAAAVLASEMRFEPRPEILSYLLLTAQLWFLHARAAGRRVPPWAPIAVQLVWTNVHGLFVLGWVATILFALGRWLETKRFDRNNWIVAGGVLLVSLVNPYGRAGVVFPFQLLTRFQAGNLFAETIGEFRPPFDLRVNDQFPFYPWWPLWTFRVMAGVALPAAIVWFRRGRWTWLLLALALLPLALKMVRNMPLLTVAVLPGMAAAVPLALHGPRTGPSPRSKRARTDDAPAAPRRFGLRHAPALLLGLAGLTIVTLSLRVAHDAYYIASRRGERFGFGWNREQLPVGAAEWARRVRPPGAMLNHLNFGGYLMWAQSAPVFIDGRLEVAGESFYADYQRILGSDVALENAVGRYGLGWIVLPYAGNSGLVQRLTKDPRWRLAWYDALAVVFVRATPGSDRLIDPKVMTDARPGPPAVPWRELPGLGGRPRSSPVARWFRGLVARETFPAADHYEGLLHFFRMELEPAGRRFTDAIAASDGRYFETYLNLGSILYRTGDREGARAAYTVVIAESPRNRTARQRLSELK